ncbi:glycosyltransferase [Mucilaginibacter sp. FT3.2]|uniref:glycosyltransferase n=1 Tax=Mucilaginibacter sp. FT3.2 TaxID=2723090 RepID=UPI00160C78C3|nr:glycosyltransferase [Mucilaginibacter sp. FT3.2]MBB6231308.1 glycosyltransferase involved in cell wall biosynthesis [Mucilaginibacter sp. FT3.2]
MTDLLSVIIPTYNPDANRLAKTLTGLQNQSLPLSLWELILVDNNSSSPVSTDLSWHLNHKIIRETEQGLTYARLKGFNEAKGQILVLVDDDNILDEYYLQNVAEAFRHQPKLGAIGGKSLPLFESPPPDWLPQFYSSLALRDLGDAVLTATWNNSYPTCAPIGAGIALRKDALKYYIKKIETQQGIITDRKGDSLSSGGDNDIVLEILKAGWQVAYLPNLSLQHIIPAQRVEANYLARLINSSSNSWVQLLQSHGINPWPQISGWTLGLRKAKAWFTYKAWQNKVSYIKWQGACGTFDGLVKKRNQTF